jgi:predicted nucleotidyltransferase
LIEQLFSSKVRIGVLKQFLLNPDDRVHAHFLSKLVDAQYNAVWKELRNLEEAGVLQSNKEGNQRLYWLNPENPILEELRAIFLKTVAVGDMLRERFEKVSKIEAAFIYGSFAHGDMDADSDLDLMLIGNLPLEELAPIITQIEANLNRSVNYIIYTPVEWRERVKGDDPFALRLLNDPKVFLIGSEDALRKNAPAESN